MKISFAILTLLWASNCLASFEMPGQGYAELSCGTSESVDFGFALKKQDESYVFTAGNQQVNVPDVPERYTLVMVLHQDKEVWIPDWFDKPLQSFDWSIAGKRIQLKQNTDSRSIDKARGGFVVLVDETPYFFHSNTAQLKFHFNQEGLQDLRIEGMFTAKR